MKTIIVPFYLILLVFFSMNTAAQRVKSKSNKKAITVKENKPEEFTMPVFKTPEEYNTWYLQDSIKQAKTDSINWIKDSIAGEIEVQNISEEFRKLYEENWHPRDSLSYVDDIVKIIINDSPGIEVDSAVFIVQHRFTSALQKARAFFYWIASTVAYDYNSFSNNLVQPIFNNDQDAQWTFKNKKGVCQNYANLYKYMCNKAGIECSIISGLGKNFPFCINPLEESNHAWNAVKTNKGWILLDATWAKRGSSAGVDNFWFDTPPEQFIYSHFPKDSGQQFLRKGLSKKAFLNFPIVSEYLFKSKLDFDIPEYRSFILTGKIFSISIPEEEKDFSVGYSIMPYQGDGWRPYLADMKEKNLETKKITDKKNKVINYTTEIPSRGIWWLSVHLIKNIKNNNFREVSFPQAVLFKITY